MVGSYKRIIWSDEAKFQLHKIYIFIRKDSPQNAIKVRQAIINSSKDLLANPEKHAPDKYKFNNNGNYRAYELYSYRIAYYIGESEIRIIRIRHTGREPQPY